MAFYLDEEEVWKCPKHPSKRRRTGICPTCLRERLASLCPDCANVRPCSCCPATTSSSSSSSSSSSHFSRFSVDTDANGGLKRSRSVAIPFLRSRSRFPAAGDRELDLDAAAAKDSSSGLAKSRSARWFLSVFKPPKSNRSGGVQEQDSSECVDEIVESVNSKAAMMRKSRSVAVSSSRDGELRGTKKGKGWYFPSPIKAFRQFNKPPKVFREAAVYGTMDSVQPQKDIHMHTNVLLFSNYKLHYPTQEKASVLALGYVGVGLPVFKEMQPNNYKPLERDQLEDPNPSV
ncbi:DUF740 family protein [Senna tora]|uniref:DUF740 family protein n=1 Tax=Senna tora TaxID=362788 RepID=A0A834W5R6_9FABA|nr:DUF740 family protein [Senna tora]